MLDIPILIFEYDETDNIFGLMPPCPDNEISENEQERLFEELCAFIDAGMFDPANEIIEPA